MRIALFALSFWIALANFGTPSQAQSINYLMLHGDFAVFFNEMRVLLLSRTSEAPRRGEVDRQLCIELLPAVRAAFASIPAKEAALEKMGKSDEIKPMMVSVAAGSIGTFCLAVAKAAHLKPDERHMVRCGFGGLSGNPQSFAGRLISFFDFYYGREGFFCAEDEISGDHVNDFLKQIDRSVQQSTLMTLESSGFICKAESCSVTTEYWQVREDGTAMFFPLTLKVFYEELDGRSRICVRRAL